MAFKIQLVQASKVMESGLGAGKSWKLYQMVVELSDLTDELLKGDCSENRH